MSRFKKIAVIAGYVVAAGLVAAGSAGAGTFTVKQCSGSGQLDFQAVYSAINGSNKVDVVNGCSVSGAGKIGIYQDRGGSDFAHGQGGQFRWDLPPTTGVAAARFSARLKDANGIKAELIGFDGSRVTDIDGGATHDGGEYWTDWSGANQPQSLIVARLICGAETGCQNNPASTRSFIEATDAEFTVRDSVAPAVTASGELWNWAGDSQFHRGSSSIRIEATDQGSGVAAVWAEVNGLRVDLAAPGCPGDRGSYSSRFSPCPASYAATKTLNTAAAPFQEGPNQLRVCARDHANPEAEAGKSCSSNRVILVDNQPSLPPVNLRSDQGSGWQPENGFTIRWNTPSGQVAPVVGAGYLLRELTSDVQVGAGYFSGAGIETGGPIQVPETGAYRLVVFLVDGAFNLGQSSETILRFDDRPPGDVNPVPASGWISRDELPIDQEIEKAEPGGPSGIAGYALTVSDTGPRRPCDFDICRAPEITLAGGADQRTGSIGGLAEGDHWITATAVSGASRSSLEPGATMVRVDRTPPATSISGVPGGWVNHPVSLTVAAEDELSGMLPQAGDDGAPETVIEAENHSPYRSSGPVATFAVATEGVNRVRFWAEDLAGNANDGLRGPGGDIHPTPGQAVVRIDQTSPQVEFDPALDPEDPELVAVSAEDSGSGVDSATIGIRRAGSGDPFKSLPTTGAEGRFQARIPSDDLARGTYELNASVRDRAGNEAIGNQTAEGGPMIRELPLKRPAALTAVLGNGKQRLLARYGSRPFVTGRLTRDGAALANQTVKVTQAFVTGSRSSSITSEMKTDGNGRYRFRLRKGPSRQVTVRFDGTRNISRAIGPELGLKVKGKVALRIKPRKLYNGGVVRMRGSVGFTGALPPARGKLVAIQYFDPTRRKWRPVEVLRTNRRGRFFYRYRFRTIGSAQQIKFRASALTEAGWPYLPSTSKPRSVIVYPKA